MAANNLTNPVLLYDWINFFSMAADAAALPGAGIGDLGNGVYARFLLGLEPVRPAGCLPAKPESVRRPGRPGDVAGGFVPSPGPHRHCADLQDGDGAGRQPGA